MPGSALIVAMFCGCSPVIGDEKPDTTAAQALLLAWQECVECSDGELEELVPHAALVGPVLQSA